MWSVSLEFGEIVFGYVVKGLEGNFVGSFSNQFGEHFGLRKLNMLKQKIQKLYYNNNQILTLNIFLTFYLLFLSFLAKIKTRSPT